MREQMERHRTNPVCASCHQVMDPIGFALENFDLVGAWRTKDAAACRSTPPTCWPTARKWTAWSRCGGRCVRRPDVFVQTLTEKLMVYALGRGLTSEDMPAGQKGRTGRGAEGVSFLSRDPGHRRQRAVPDADEGCGSGGLELASRTGHSYVHHQDVTATADVSSGLGRDGRAAAARRDGAGGDRARTDRGHAAVRGSASSTFRTAPTWRRGRPRPPAPASSCRPRWRRSSRSRTQMVVVSNLKRAGGQAEMHAAAASGWLSGAIPKRTEAEDLACGTSIDQVLAQQIGQSSPFPVARVRHRRLHRLRRRMHAGLQLRLSRRDRLGVADDAAADGDQSARARSSGCLATAASTRSAAATCVRTAASSTASSNDMRALQTRLGAHDRARVDTYLQDVREIERRIQRNEAQQRADVTFEKPLGIPDSFEAHTALMTDLLALAYQTELTHVFTFMMSREGSQRTFGPIGVTDPWHVDSHHGDKAEKVAQQRQDQRVLSADGRRVCSRSCGRTPDGDGSILDHSLIFYGSGMANSNVHATDPLPMVAVGGGARPRQPPHRPAEGNADRQPLADGGESVRQPEQKTSARARAQSSCSDETARIAVAFVRVPDRRRWQRAGAQTRPARRCLGWHYAASPGRPRRRSRGRRAADSLRRRRQRGEPLWRDAAFARRAARARRSHRRAAQGRRQRQDRRGHAARGADAADARRANRRRGVAEGAASPPAPTSTRARPAPERRPRSGPRPATAPTRCACWPRPAPI